MSIIISALHFHWRDIADCCRVVREELGLDGVELSLHESFAHPHCTREDLAALPAATEGVQLDAHIWEDVARLGPEAGADALLGWLEVARLMGIGGLVLHGGSYPERGEGLARVQACLARVLGPFERAGVTLKLENHYPYTYHDCHELFSEPWEFAELFDALTSPALYACFDTGHAHMAGNWESLLAAMAPRLTHIHLADNGGVDDDHRPYRQGTVPWDAMLAAWRRMGYAGTWCVEFPIYEDREPLRQCVGDIQQG